MRHSNKIYYIVNARMPNEKAHGIQIAKMCEAFVETGYYLELIVPNRGTIKEPTMTEFYKLRAPIKTVKLPVINLYNNGQIGFFLSSLTFMCSYVVYLLWKRITAPGIIYTVDMDTFSFFALPFLGMSVFTEMHTPKSKTIATRVFFHFVSGVIATNSLIQSNLVSTFKIPNRKFLIEPNGIDIKQFAVRASRDESRKKLGLPLDKKVALYVGRFYQWKGLDIIPKVSEELPHDVLVYIIGGTKEEFKKVVPSKLISENIIFVGSRNYTEIPDWLSAADMLLVLGTTKNQDSYQYTSPMKIFEYMAAERPIIASNTPAVREVLSEKEAVFYEPDNPHDLKNKILYVCFHTSKTQDMAEQARIKAKYFSWDNRVERIGNFIRKVT